MMHSVLFVTAGLAGGLLSGFFGAGGGIPIALFLGRDTTGTKQFATTLAVTFALALCTLIFYLWRGACSVWDVLPFLLPSAAGGICGAWLSERLQSRRIRQIFGAVSLLSGILLLVKR